MIKVKLIRDFKSVYIEKYTYLANEYEPKRIYFEVYSKDFELLDSFKTAKQAKKFCKKWIIENISLDDF